VTSIVLKLRNPQPALRLISNVKPLRANSLPTASIQTQNFENRFADYFPRLLHHICRANSLSLRQWGAQETMAGIENLRKPPKISSNPFAERILRRSPSPRGS